MDDLAYLYLDLAAMVELRDAVLVGACFGGWIAAEMAVCDTRRFARLVLVDAVGIKVGGVTDRDIADMHAMTREAFMRRACVRRGIRRRRWRQGQRADHAARGRPWRR